VPSWPRSHDSWTYNYLCNRCLSPLMLWVRISIRTRCTTLFDKVGQWFVTGRWFSPGPPVSSNNKTDRHHINEILLKVDHAWTSGTISGSNVLPCAYSWNVDPSLVLLWSPLCWLRLCNSVPECCTYLIKLVSDLLQVGGFLRVLRFLPTIKLTATI
jgi:hypothetical protein